MNKKDSFFIGWQNDMPEANRKFLRKHLVLIFILIPIIGFLFVFFQKPFNDHIFDFGNVTEITGTYFDKPYPLLIRDQQFDGNNNNILLIGFGKYGAEGAMKEIMAKSGNLNGKKITLAGTLVQGDGKTLLELTNGIESFQGIVSHEIQTPEIINNISPFAGTGEILDPKCYFGVMKPGEGKIHKSCAIRCISGGIPPVFRHESEDSNNPYKYYLILDSDGNAINQEILPYVAEHIEIKGTSTQQHGWNVLYIKIRDLNIIK